MKRFIWIVWVFVFYLVLSSGSGFAEDSIPYIPSVEGIPPSVSLPSSVPSVQSQSSEPTPTNTGSVTTTSVPATGQTNANNNANTNTNNNTNALNVAGSPVQSSLATSDTVAVQNSEVIVLSVGQQQNIPNTTVFPMPMPLIQGGKVGDITDQLPNFAGMKKLRLPSIIKNNNGGGTYDPGDIIDPDKIASFSGGWFWRITLENVWQKIAQSVKKAQQEGGWDPAKVRYRVYYKDRATGAGISLGGNIGGSHTSADGYGKQSTLGGFLGYAHSVADPIYIVMVCEIVEEPLPNHLTSKKLTSGPQKKPAPEAPQEEELTPAPQEPAIPPSQEPPVVDVIVK